MSTGQWQDPPEYRDPGYGGQPQLAMPPLTPGVRKLIYATGGAFLVTFVVFLIQPAAFRWIRDWFAISPGTWIDAAPFLPLWQLVTWGLLHDPMDAFHILGNMLMLYFLGTMLEEAIGARRLFVFYVGALLFSGIATLAVGLAAGPITIPEIGLERYPSTLGASGAVLAIVVATAMLHPTRRIIFLLFPITLRTLAIFLVSLDIFYMLLQLSGQGADNVARLAHLTGAGWGYLMVKRGWIWRDLGATVDGWRAQREEGRRASDEHRLDDLLAKISRDGIGSLNRSERAFLKRKSKQRP